MREKVDEELGMFEKHFARLGVIVRVFVDQPLDFPELDVVLDALAVDLLVFIWPRREDSFPSVKGVAALDLRNSFYLH